MIRKQSTLLSTPSSSITTTGADDSGYAESPTSSGSTNTTSSEIMFNNSSSSSSSNKGYYRQMSNKTRGSSITSLLSSSTGGGGGGGGMMMDDAKSHQLCDAIFTVPVLCHFCYDYIWGNGKVGLQCEDCQKCFHTDCLAAYKSLSITSSSSSTVSSSPSDSQQQQQQQHHHHHHPHHHHQQQIQQQQQQTNHETDVKIPDINAIENCSFYSSASSPISHVKIQQTTHQLDNFLVPPPPLTTLSLHNRRLIPAYVKVSDWTPRMVTEWMAVVNLWDIANLFIEREVTGEKLLNLNKNFLETLGIHDDFSQSAILTCVEELRSQEQQNNPDSSSSSQQQQRQKLATYHFSVKDHHFLWTTWSTMTKCNSCQMYLRGFFHQGLMCQKCGYIAHQMCAALGLPDCDKRASEKNRAHLSYLHHKVPGKHLKLSYDPSHSAAPEPLIALCTELERRFSTDPQHLFQEITSVFNSSTQSLIKTNPDLWNSLSSATRPNPSAIIKDWKTEDLASSIRRYLRELPEPLIPTTCYENFIHVGQLQIDSDALLMLNKLVVNSLPSHHSCCLRYFVSHLAKICEIAEKWANNGNGHVDAEKILSQFYGAAILRPAWENIMSVLNNFTIHSRIVSLLIELYGGLYRGENKRSRRNKSSSSSSNLISDGNDSSRASSMEFYMSRQQSLTSSSSLSSSKYSKTERELQNSEWYWEGLTREEVVEKLWDCPDGSFLVRDASTKNGEYTLTVLYGQTPKLLRISQRNGKYGLTEPYSFRSVVHLIEYYREHSLAEYNNSLDVKLLYPISKFDKGDDEEDKDKMLAVLGEVSRDFLVKSRYFELHSGLHAQTMDEIHLKQQAINAFECAIGFFREQLSTHKALQEKAGDDPQTMNELSDNFSYLKKKLTSMEESRDQVDQSLSKQKAYCRLVEMEIVAIKPQLGQLRKQRSRLVKRMEFMNIEVESALAPCTIDIWEETIWFKSDATRQEAQYILKDRQIGTFLVRKSTKGELALSLTLTGGIVGHCIIYQGSVGFGFTRQTTYFPSARSLILYYSCHSLEECNPQLKTCLKFPAFAQQVQGQQQQQQQQQQHMGGGNNNNGVYYMQ